MQWLVPLAVGAWAVWTWAHEQQQTRERERARMAALYVNPFLAACEELQYRIYRVLEGNGLRDLQDRYPDGTYADETLYLIVCYFGWVATISRYGHYTHDPMVMRLATAVRRAFSDNAEQSVGPFNFFLPEQKAFGKMVMSSTEGQHGLQLDTVSYYQFKDSLSAHPLSESYSVKQSLETLRSASQPRDIGGWQRLAQAQNHLVDLLDYMEEKEGYSLFPGERNKCAMV